MQAHAKKYIHHDQDGVIPDMQRWFTSINQQILPITQISLQTEIISTGIEKD